MVKRLQPLIASVQQTIAPLAALVLAMVSLRLPEIYAANSSVTNLLGTTGEILGSELLALLRWLPIGCLAAWPVLSMTTSGRVRLLSLGLLGSLVLMAQGTLIHYYTLAGTPLGADLFAYSLAEIRQTALASSASLPSAVHAAALFSALVIYWGVLWSQARASWPVLPTKALASVLAVSMSSFFWVPEQWSNDQSTHGLLTTSKLDYFMRDVVAKALQNTQSNSPQGPQVKAYPFARQEQTPDTLGPLLNLKDESRPNFVFIIVEGLGRSFSGPNARLGSFTPFLDELADKSLYWKNFLATQGRTFAVLPSIFGSLPFAKEGFNALAPNMPAHDSLLSLLKTEGYDLRYYTGSQLEFDNQGIYLLDEGVERVFSVADFNEPGRKLTEWGYSDSDLLAAVSSREHETQAAPSLTIVQTMSMHEPFEFPGREEFELRVETRLDKLGISQANRAQYLNQRKIYASLLYTDDSLRRFFTEMASSPSWANTIVVITGDHRLPELPMNSRLERYHVPLIIYSPMISETRRIGAISSHFDIGPSILAMLSQKYGIKTPTTVSWMGSGLDVTTAFRNVHAIPLQQTKTELSDYIHTDFYLAQDRLYRLTDGLQAAPVDSPDTLKHLRELFSAFLASNASVLHSTRLTPPASAGQRMVYAFSPRELDLLKSKVGSAEVLVSGADAKLVLDGMIKAQGRFSYEGSGESAVFVPLLVLTNAKGVEMGEAYSKAISLKSGESMSVKLQLTPKNLDSGPYFVSLIVSHPDTGKPIGIGQYHVEVSK